MRKLLFFVIIIIGISACDNQEQVFPDYNLQAVYFPVQLPLRTLSLGEDRVDNTLDRAYMFDIGVSIGGMYENKWDWTVDYKLDPSLTFNAFNTFGVPFVALPENYYSISPLNTAIIPKGSFNGLIRIELNELFFNDTLSLTGSYVVPIRLTNTNADSILSGKQSGAGLADVRIKSDWESGKSPKNWVMYGIKYVNAYHGSYLHRGRDIISNAGVPVDTVEFRNRYVEKDMLIKLKTIGLMRVVSNGIGVNTSITGKYSMELEFSNSEGASGPVTIKPVQGSDFAVTGTGKYFSMADSKESWTGLVWQSMYLNYSYYDGTNNHQVSDTLVFRDRGIKYEENSIIIVK